MAYRPRNVPAVSKSEMEVQTDVKLLESNLIEQQHQQEEIHAAQSDLRLSRVYNRHGLLRPFTDQQLLREFSKTLQELRSAQPSDNVYGKRLELLQKQIDGLLRRDILINGGDGEQSYYSTLNQKQKSIIRSENEKIYTDAKIERLRKQIDTLDREVVNLRSALVNSQKAVQENKLYASFYERVNQTVTNGKNKGIQLLQIIEEQLVPITTEFTFNLAALTRTINKDIHQSTRAVVLNLAKEFDRLLKQQQWNEEKLNDTVIGLINNFKAVRGVDYLKNQFESALKTQQSEENYTNILSLFKHEVQILKQEGKGTERLDALLRKLEGANVELFECKGWVNLVSPQIRTIQVNADDNKLKQLIGIVAGEFKRAYLKFPQLKNHVSPKLIDIFDSEVLVELIEGASIDKLSSIIIHSADLVRVDNIYQYESSIDRKTVFHLRVLLKRLLEELESIKKKHGIDLTLDEGILCLLREHTIDGFNTEDYISLFRPIPKIVEVPILVETPVFETKTFEKGIPIHTERQILLRQEKVSVVPIRTEVPVYIEKPIEHVINNSVPVTIETQKAVPVDITREVIVERVVESTVEVPTIREKTVPVYDREEVVRQIEVQKLVDKVILQQVQKIVQIGGREYVEVERIVEKPVYLYETRQQIKEVEVKVPQIIEQTKYLTIEKRVPYIIEHKQIVNVKLEVPVEIRVPEIELVDVVEYRDKPIVVKQYREVVKEIPITKEKELLRETPKEIFIERSHFVKSDQIEVIREVEVFVDKPIIREILTTKDVQIEKVVPLYITEQVPVIHEISVPYVVEKTKELQVEVVKIVRQREEVVKPIHLEKSVPVIMEREVVKIEKHVVEKIVEKIVEVPRIVEIERIVEKIVVVPRIVERIVEVPKIIERIVVVEKPVLQLVEIQVPYVVMREVEKIVEVVVEKIVVQYVKEVQIVEVEKVVERIIERDRPVEVQVEKRIPYEVIREVAVPTYRDRVDYQKVEIHQTKVETIEVQVPFLFQEQVPFYVERPIVTEHLVEQPVYQKLYIEKEKPIINQVEKLVIREVIVERAIVTEVVRQVPGPETIKYVDVPLIVEVVHEKIVQLHDRVEVPKEIYLLQQKIVHEIQERLVQVPVNSIVTTPQLLEVPKLVHLTHYKQIAVDVPVREERVRRDIFQQIKTVEVIREVPVEIQIVREKIKEITNEIREYITSEIVREIHTEVEVRSPVEYREVQVAGQTIVQEIKSSSRTVQIQDKIIERVVEKIVMLPQIVEVVRNIHHISEVNSLGIAVDIDITLQTERFQGVNQQLRAALLQLLISLRSSVNRQPELKSLIAVIEKHLKAVDDWIAFPKLIEIPKEVYREVEKEKIVLVPTPDRQKEAVFAYIIEKLVNELRRIRETHQIEPALEQELLELFFAERRAEEGLEGRYAELSQSLKSKIGAFGSWGESNPFLVNCFLQDHFSYKTMVEENNRIQEGQTDELNSLRHQLDIAVNKYENLVYFNRKMYEDNSTLIRTLEKYKDSIQDEQFNENLKTHREFYEQLAEEKHSLVLSSIKKTYHQTESIIEGLTPEQGEGRQSFVELMGKLTQYESRNQEFVVQTRTLEREVQKYRDEVNSKNNIIQRLQNDFEIKLTRTKEEMARNPNLNREIADSNRDLQEKNRQLERQVSNQKLSADRAKKELERNLQNLQRDYQGKLEKKDKEVKESAERAKKENEREINKAKLQIDRLKAERDRFEAELVETQRKAAQQFAALQEQQLGTASEKQAQLINDNMELRQRIQALQEQYDRLQQSASDSNANHDKQLARLRQQIQKLNSDKRKSQTTTNVPQQAQRKNAELTRKIQTLENELNQLKGRDTESSGELKTLRLKVKRLQTELETSKTEVELAKRQKLQSTTFGSSGNKPITSLIEAPQASGLGSASRSPRASGYKSTYEKGFMSPEISQSREQLGEGFVSSESRMSKQSGEQLPMSSPYKSQMSLRDFMETKNPDQKQRDICITFIMIKVIEKLEQEVEMGRFSSYSPSNIMIGNFHVKNLDEITIKLGYPITSKSNKTDGLYLAPEIVAGGAASKKSLVFSLGVILDELIHGSNFFKSTDEIQNVQIEFRVRGEKMNPILKNTLFEMMSKDANKRLELLEAKRRLSLQKYISSEGRGSVTTSIRYTRPT